MHCTYGGGGAALVEGVKVVDGDGRVHVLQAGAAALHDARERALARALHRDAPRRLDLVLHGGEHRGALGCVGRMRMNTDEEKRAVRQ